MFPSTAGGGGAPDLWAGSESQSFDYKILQMTVIIIIDTAIRSGYEETKGCHCQGNIAFRQTSETLSYDNGLGLIMKPKHQLE